MTKKEIVDMIAEIYVKFENLEGSIEELVHEAKAISREIDQLPSDEEDITDEEKED